MWRTARGGPSATTGLDQPGQALCAAERRREDGRSAPRCPSQPACSPQRSLLPPAGGQGAHTDPAPALCWATRRALATEPTGHSGQRPEQGPPSEDSKPRGPLSAPTPVASGGRVDPGCVSPSPSLHKRFRGQIHENGRLESSGCASQAGTYG